MTFSFEAKTMIKMLTILPVMTIAIKVTQFGSTQS